MEITPQSPPPSSAPLRDDKKGGSPLKWVAIGCAAVLAIGLIIVVSGGLFVGKKLKDPKVQAQLSAAACDVGLASALDDAREFQQAKGRFPNDARELAAAALKEPFKPAAIDLVCTGWTIAATDGGKGVEIVGRPKKDPTGACVITYTAAGVKFTPECPKTLSHP